jgi:hypothetical protein
MSSSNLNCSMEVSCGVVKYYMQKKLGNKTGFIEKACKQNMLFNGKCLRFGVKKQL